MTPESEHILKVLKVSIRVLGFRQQDIEKKLGVAQGYLSRLFRGIIQLRFDHIVDISRAIGMEPNELLQIAYPQPIKTPTPEARRIRERLGTLLPAASQPMDSAPEPAPRPHAGRSSSIEEETERIERIVLQVFEKFFSSIAKSAVGRE
jgi:transcriptional regulator with XRE-family HTH domain